MLIITIPATTTSKRRTIIIRTRPNRHTIQTNWNPVRDKKASMVILLIMTMVLILLVFNIPIRTRTRTSNIIKATWILERICRGTWMAHSTVRIVIASEADQFSARQRTASRASRASLILSRIRTTLSRWERRKSQENVTVMLTTSTTCLRKLAKWLGRTPKILSGLTSCTRRKKMVRFSLNGIISLTN